MQQILPKSLHPLLGHRLEILPRAVGDLCSMGESFFLYLYSTDPISQKFTPLLDRYLNYLKSSLLVVSLLIDHHPQSQVDLEVVIVPQLRYIVNGRIVRSHKGFADYEALDALFRVNQRVN